MEKQTGESEREALEKNKEDSTFTCFLLSLKFKGIFWSMDSFSNFGDSWDRAVPHILKPADSSKLIGHTLCLFFLLG